MRCEILAVGTELLLGQIVDTNSAWLGEQLALAGIDHYRQVKVGDNHGRIVAALREGLAGADAVIVCGGLGPTQDDITREAVAEVMGVPLEVDEAVAEAIRAMFASRGRAMPESNLRQAQVPRGATVIEQRLGTAPGLICPVEAGPGGPGGVVYLVPGVPYEMEEMMTRAVLPDLRRRAGSVGAIRSRVLRTWGESESALAELVSPRVRALDATGNPTIAFQASGIEGLKVRITARAEHGDEAMALVVAEEAEVRALLGDLVFGVDDDTMEVAVGRLLLQRGLTLAVAESVTGGLMASRLVAAAGASRFFVGGVVAYEPRVKREVLGVPPGPVVSEASAVAMAEGVRRHLGAAVGVSTTGVAGPEELEGNPVGTVWLGLAVGDRVDAVRVRVPGDRHRVRQYAAITALDRLRRALS